MLYAVRILCAWYELAGEKEKIMNEFPLLVILLDYVLGAAMWTLIGRFGMSIFVSEHSDFFFMRAFVKFTDPMIKAMAKLTPPSDRPVEAALCGVVFVYD